MMAVGGVARARLLRVLDDAREAGLVGPGPVLPHLEHALGFAGAVEVSGGPRPGRCLDLGSGAGLPGLPLAVAWPRSWWLLLDAGRRRASFLEEAIERLELGGRVVVREGRAEELARVGELRGGFDLVVARGFGPPAVTAECGAGFLVAGGRLVVSEPPGGDPRRWPVEGLDQLGLELGAAVAGDRGSYQVLWQRRPCPERFPRRVGVPAKRPLFAFGDADG